MTWSLLKPMSMICTISHIFPRRIIRFEVQIYIFIDPEYNSTYNRCIVDFKWNTTAEWPSSSVSVKQSWIILANESWPKTTSLKSTRLYIPDSKVHGANKEPIWGRHVPDGFHVGPMNLAIWVNVILILCRWKLRPPNISYVTLAGKRYTSWIPFLIAC